MRKCGLVNAELNRLKQIQLKGTPPDGGCDEVLQRVLVKQKKILRVVSKQIREKREVLHSHRHRRHEYEDRVHEKTAGKAEAEMREQLKTTHLGLLEATERTSMAEEELLVSKDTKAR